MRHFDLVIIGTGSGNSIPGPEFDDWQIAIVEDNLFGGTCLNVGCIPTKMYVYPAELAAGTVHAGPLGVTAHVDHVDWAGIRDRIFGRIDAIEAGGRRYRKSDECPNITVFEGVGAFTGRNTLAVDLRSGGVETITADRFVLAAGSRAVIPDVPGLSDVPFHTSDTVMRIDTLPPRVTILGSGYIAAEFAHVFASFGAGVTQLARGDALLRKHDHDISAAYTTYASNRYDLRTDTALTAVKPAGDAIALHLDGPKGPSVVETDLLLVAVGRTPNSDRLAVSATGVATHPDGRVVVDEYQRTSAPGIYALGDICSEHELKHVANHEARVVRYNLAHPDDPRPADHRFVPSAVFTEPQIASVGLTEEQAIARGIEYVTSRQAYGDIAAGWAREDTTGFCKLLADPDTGLLLGAHLIGPEAATVIQPLIQAMSFGLPAQRMARGQYWIHPALPELVENALLGLPLRVPVEPA